MSIEAARAFMQTVQRGIVAHHEAPTFWFDCDTVLTTVARFGASAGFAFTGEEYRKVVTEHIEAQLVAGKVTKPSKFLLFLHDLVDNGKDYLTFVRGSREHEGWALVGDCYVNLIGGSVRS